MDRQVVRSATIHSIGYDAAASTLEIEFLNGRVYQYFGVPQHIADGLLTAASPTTYLNQFVKKLGCSYQRLS